MCRFVKAKTKEKSKKVENEVKIMQNIPLKLKIRGSNHFGKSEMLLFSKSNLKK